MSLGALWNSTIHCDLVSLNVLLECLRQCRPASNGCHFVLFCFVWNIVFVPDLSCVVLPSIPVSLRVDSVMCVHKKIEHPEFDPNIYH